MTGGAGILIRPATRADIPALAALMVRSYAHAFAGILPPAALASRDQDFFVDRFAGQWPTVAVAVDAAGALAGLVQVRERHLDLLFLAPERIGAGIGALLLAHAVATGATALECFRDNRPARRFYERHGWTVADRYERDFAGGLYAFLRYERS